MRTDNEHGPRGSLNADSTNGQKASSPVNGVVEHIPEPNAAGILALSIQGTSNLSDFMVDVRAGRSQPR